MTLHPDTRDPLRFIRTIPLVFNCALFQCALFPTTEAYPNSKHLAAGASYHVHSLSDLHTYNRHFVFQFTTTASEKSNHLRAARAMYANTSRGIVWLL
jgi:hypothetical protein